jgi:hypothetical protein
VGSQRARDGAQEAAGFSCCRGRVSAVIARVTRWMGSRTGSTMSLTAMFIAALVILPAIGLVLWAWFAMAQIEEDLRSFIGFEGLHFDIWLRAARMVPKERHVQSLAEEEPSHELVAEHG